MKTLNQIVEEKIRRWYSEAGSQSVMIDDMPEEAFNSVVDKFRNEAAEELKN